MNPGRKTSEFWLSLAVIAAATAMVVARTIGPEIWAAIVLGQGTGYTASRTLLKRSNSGDLEILDEGPEES